MHFSCPSHPLVYAFLLQEEPFCYGRKLIVETQEKGEELLKIVQAIQNATPPMPVPPEAGAGRECKMHNDSQNAKSQNFRLIASLVDLAEFENDPSIVGIFTPESLGWHILPDERDKYYLHLQSGMGLTEEALITWLTDHGFQAKKSDEIGTFFRVGDTVSVPTTMGIIRISFMGDVVESIFCDQTAQTDCRIYSRANSDCVLESKSTLMDKY